MVKIYKESFFYMTCQSQQSRERERERERNVWYSKLIQNFRQNKLLLQKRQKE